MYPEMVYHADVRARQKELAATERGMGGCSSCAPLGRMMSRFLMKCNGRRQGRVRYDERMGMDYAMAYAPTQTCYVRPTSARTVTLAATATNAHAHADHTDPHPPAQAHAATTTTILPGSAPFAPAGDPAPQRAGMPPRKPNKKKKKKRVQFAPSGPPHDTAAAAGGGGGSAASGYHGHHGPAADPSYSPEAPGHGHGGYAYGYGRYAPSPLPRWEGTPRLHEYFSGEYRWYYPTPVREGIYSIATDANGRLSTIFSEENPNACTIV